MPHAWCTEEHVCGTPRSKFPPTLSNKWHFNTNRDRNQGTPVAAAVRAPVGAVKAADADCRAPERGAEYVGWSEERRIHAFAGRRVIVSGFR
ncbi:hypothetical protein GOP47_0012313 [Adiantum capillus-veneris]|uniref:Uncharacterized protein n=1 Tax=Adiantum capillus-veneris TaxID=13818 RepID=A0A9D4URH5_ADICA|nr:hypothetical protein GOP47_0012313 [Adiantum capillus-veneris]